MIGNTLGFDKEGDRSWVGSKITPRPLTLPRQFKVEPSDFALGLVTSGYL